MNIEIIDNWLNEEYGVSYTDLEELHNRQVDKIIELQEKYTQVLEVAQDRFERIYKAIEYIENNICGGAVSNANEIIKILEGNANESN